MAVIIRFIISFHAINNRVFSKKETVWNKTIFKRTGLALWHACVLASSLMAAPHFVPVKVVATDTMTVVVPLDLAPAPTVMKSDHSRR